ncbi:hypothetical protein ACFQQB_41125 [Nonomuraea rubra]|uniref:hypothetical protein n=1 Tax=Nonomuraea rubra TaxID=46180 RepID=UPI00361632E8
MNPANRLAQISFTAGPAALLAGWFLMRPIHGGLEPGPWWTAAHLAWLAAFAMFGLMTLAMRGLAMRDPSRPVTGGRRVAVESVTVLALFGVAANLAQLAIDLYTGFAAADGEALRGLLDDVKGYPGVEPVVYGPGAQLFYAAVLAHAVVLAVLRRVTPVSAAVTAGAWCCWRWPRSRRAGTRPWSRWAWRCCGWARCCWAGAGPPAWARTRRHPAPGGRARRPRGRPRNS